MKLWLIRHAAAVEADEFSGSDLERPLTSKGRLSAKKAFKQLARIRSAPDVVISSCAVRAIETARLFGKAFGVNDIRQTAILNPGCSFREIKKVVAGLPANIPFAALVGHEPDFSDAVSRWTSGGKLSLALKKGGLVELELHDNETVDLVMAFPPDILNKD
jgi:phosphohistidine phosphatase